MSFMFKPLAYDDPKAVNHITLPESLVSDVSSEIGEIAGRLAAACMGREGKAPVVLGIDGYVSAMFDPLVSAVEAELESKGKKVLCLPMEALYKTEEEIHAVTAESLPLNYEEDPVLLFGRLYCGTIDDLIDQEKVCSAFSEENDDIVLVYGLGSLSGMLRSHITVSAYVDVTPKTAAIRAREKKFANIGDREPQPFPLLMRRNYYVDFEVVVKLRKELLTKNLLDFYLLGNEEDSYLMMSGSTMDGILGTLVLYPFRAKPVYLEGIWGGEFIRKVRGIPLEIADNVAWIFDMIPMEVSIVVKAGDRLLDFPFSTFVQKKGLEMMGERCVKEFEGYFPIRFNYDDTWHSNGNMSVQVHPDEDFTISHYDEFGRQDEAYYVIATGHDAKTYCGFKGDGRKFLELARESEQTHESFPYQDYINAIDSVPGRQIMLPAGTIHASGRNQLILELGSLTIGSYTYKVYDYNRRDKEGKPRPIHADNAASVLHFERNSEWVQEHAAIQPVLLEKTEEYQELVVGKTELMYYEARRIELKTHGRYEGRNLGQFTVVTVVDGERARIYSRSNPEFSFTAEFLDIVTIPATIEDYVIEAGGYQPVVIHKVILRSGYTRYKNPVYYDRKRE